jgi:hypothetical protein
MSKAKQSKSVISGTDGEGLSRPISALLSQVLVAFTIEFDNEFERRMSASGYTGQLLSLVVWSNVIRFIPEGGLPVHELAAKAFAPHERTKFQLGCLERWRIVELVPDPSDPRTIRLSSRRRAHAVLRDGWGSGRGIRANWIVRLTAKGQKAKEIWPPLFDLMEQRWQTRFGRDEIISLQTSLQAIVGQLEVELPQGLPEAWLVTNAFPARVSRDTEDLTLPTLLSQLLQAFTIEFDRASPAPLALCANVLRILGEKPVRVGEISRLTGGSPETTSIGWQLRPYVAVEPDPTAKRGKVARLTPRGLQAQQTYHRLAHEIEKGWEVRYGQRQIRCVRACLQGLLNQRNGERPAMSEGLIPPPGVVRAGVQAPALGRRDVGVAARQRMRDLVRQTEEFVRDPIGTLPHYPLWDMNRGFGP